MLKHNNLLVGLLFVLSGSIINAKASWLTFEPRPFRPIVSDVKEVKFDYIVLNEKRVNATIGSHYPIVHVASDANQLFQLGCFALTLNRLQIKEGFAFDLNSYDAVFGAYTDYRRGAWSASFRYTHTSTHLSEGYYRSANEDITSFRYSREHLQFLNDYTWRLLATDLRALVGLTWVNASVSPDDIRGKNLYGLMAGAEIEFSTLWFLQPFISVTVSAQTETNYFVSKSLAFGIKFKGSGEGNFRLVAHYFDGIDPRGNFYLKKTEFFGMGLAYFF